MAIDQFIKIGDLEGESKDSSHAGEVEVLAWSWGMSQSGTMHSGTGGGAGKVSVQDMSITKYVDKSSPNLYKACCNGKQFEEATLTVRKAGEQPLEYVIIKMSPVIITNISTGGSSGDDLITENVTLNFAQVGISYTPQKSDGSGDAAVEACWNIAENTEC
ncbi:MAG: type VI secretion system tube protein Hcp [Gammaproteobacteria bacterium]|nr:type VI secretion system tube protein Hcp [Gammaproteobacteria bacterium]